MKSSYAVHYPLGAFQDVLDDFIAEAEEVYTHNSWLVYSEIIHMARIFGLGHKVFDLLDERPLLPMEMCVSCILIQYFLSLESVGLVYCLR